MKLFLDDFRTPDIAFRYTYDQIYLAEDWVIVRNFEEFCKAITRYYKESKKLFPTPILPDLISFDHDLADEHYAPEEYWNDYNEWAKEQKFKEKTGYDCAKWLVDFCQDHNVLLPEFLCHTMNPVGKQNIMFILTNFRKFQKQQRNEINKNNPEEDSSEENQNL